MPKYHFNSDDYADREGFEFASLAEAKCEAIKTFAGIICDHAKTFWDHDEWTMTVTDERGLTLFQLHIVRTESAPTINSVRQASASLPPALAQESDCIAHAQR